MAKAADYFISGVWFSQLPHRHISYVMLHPVSESNGVITGSKTSRESVLRLLDAKKIIKTLVWRYSDRLNYDIGAVVDSELVKGTRYLRSDPDKTARDNLHNLLPMDQYGI